MLASTARPARPSLVWYLLAAFAGAALVACLCLPAAPAAQGEDSKLQAMLKAKLATVQEIASQTRKAYQSGNVDFSQVHDANRALRAAELELCQSDKERAAVLAKG